MAEIPFIKSAAFRDEVEAEIRALLIARGHDVDEEGPVPISPTGGTPKSTGGTGAISRGG